MHIFYLNLVYFIQIEVLKCFNITDYYCKDHAVYQTMWDIFPEMSYWRVDNIFNNVFYSVETGQPNDIQTFKQHIVFKGDNIEIFECKFGIMTLKLRIFTVFQFLTHYL